MNFLFHLRSDAYAKHGGDVALGRQYKALLEGAGHSVELTTTAGAFSGAYDGALTFNLDRPFESAQFVDSCARRTVPVLVYCLHHPDAGVSSYLRAGATGFRRLCARLARYDPRSYETLLTLVKVLAGRFKVHRWVHLRFIDTKRAQRFIVANASLLLGSSALENAEIARDLGARPGALAVVPHILEVLAAAPHVPAGGQLPRDIDVLCAGRIESRKNQLQVARLARAFPAAKFVFIGNPSPSEAAYFAAFSAEIRELGNVQYFPSLPIDDLRNMFSRARIFISLSWFEVVSLTEMEAFARGCALLVGRYSYASEFVAGRASWVDPADVAAVEKALRGLLAGDPGGATACQLDPQHQLNRLAPAQVLVAFERAFVSAGIKA